ncbi:hypothetical protein [Phenylobacterium sp.]|uniref:hypothetical protein n=1 Tax=Phenylobacterium sp. TaxID=1871053 RepID=UPI0025EA2807|nr:hypothetical protein [Phenylobacterium sp.]MBX3482646.1 hypothetical protein [Phenylobacterium sp.]MCW5759333.1 hypothetical protein [Phenylobacterium sp.]
MLEILFAAAVTLARLPAREANQGVAVDAHAIYAVDNSTIAKYDRRTGKRVGAFEGDPGKFPHMNSCAAIGRELVCAASNYPATPMVSQVEVFDPQTLAHLRTVPLGQQRGSITWVDRREGSWFAGFANYDGKGGEPGRDHRTTKVVRFDDQWRAHETWTFPADVLARFAPRSNSGGSFGADGRLYVTGHDHPELYVLEVPKGGGVMKRVATIAIPVNGQAVAFDRSDAGVMFGVNRASREIVGFRLPPVEGK